MPRSRNIKPAFFGNEYLAELTPYARLLFVGLWCLADKLGRLEDRPLRIKGHLFPFENLDVNELLESLANSPGEFIVRYDVQGKRYIQVLNFEKHQNPHRNEKPSEIPEMERTTPEKERSSPVMEQTAPADSLKLIPDTLKPDENSELSSDETISSPSPIWGDGLNLLVSAGNKVSSSRAFLGKLLKDYGETAVQSAIAKAIEVEAVEPKSFLQGVLKNQQTSGARVRGHGDTLINHQDWLTPRQCWEDNHCKSCYEKIKDYLEV